MRGRISGISKNDPGSVETPRVPSPEWERVARVSETG
jgi:hypothetical protein